jgi:hypothetical protein
MLVPKIRLLKSYVFLLFGRFYRPILAHDETTSNSSCDGLRTLLKGIEFSQSLSPPLPFVRRGSFSQKKIPLFQSGKGGSEKPI